MKKKKPKKNHKNSRRRPIGGGKDVNANGDRSERPKKSARDRLIGITKRVNNTTDTPIATFVRTPQQKQTKIHEKNKTAIKNGYPVAKRTRPPPLTVMICGQIRKKIIQSNTNENETDGPKKRSTRFDFFSFANQSAQESGKRERATKNIFKKLEDDAFHEKWRRSPPPRAPPPSLLPRPKNGQRRHLQGYAARPWPCSDPKPRKKNVRPQFSSVSLSAAPRLPPCPHLLLLLLLLLFTPRFRFCFDCRFSSFEEFIFRFFPRSTSQQGTRMSKMMKYNNRANDREVFGRISASAKEKENKMALFFGFFRLCVSFSGFATRRFAIGRAQFRVDQSFPFVRSFWLVFFSKFCFQRKDPFLSLSFASSPSRFHFVERNFSIRSSANFIRLKSKQNHRKSDPLSLF